MTRHTIIRGPFGRITVPRMPGHVWRVAWTRPTWTSHGNSSRLYSTEHGAARLAEKLRRTGAIVTVDRADRTVWKPCDL